MESALRQLVDTYWADTFGVPVEHVWDEGVHLSINTDGWPGVFVVRLGGANRVSVPASLSARVADAIRTMSPGAAFVPATWELVLGDLRPTVLGPSVHAYTDNLDSVPEPTDADGALEVEQIAPWRLTGLRSAVSTKEWEEAGFGAAVDVAFARYVDHTIAAAANLTSWRGSPTDLGVLTHPQWRGQGHGLRAAGEATRFAVAEHGVARWRSLTTNRASRALAHRLGFIEYGSNIAVRLQD